MKRKTKIIEQTIMSTMVGPLWARAYYGKRNPEILVDPHAEEIFNKLKIAHPDYSYEFSIMEEFIDEMAGISFIIRARVYEDLIKDYLKDNPDATIVNIGCGLDTTFFRVDNGSLKWYNLDLPDAINYRKQFISDSPRSKSIPKSMLDYSWFGELDFDPQNGIFFFAAGLINYFNAEEISEFFRKISLQFPGAIFAFDNPSSTANKMVNKRLKKLKVTGSNFYFAIDDPVGQFSKISNRIYVIDWFSFYKKINKNPKWKLRTKIKIFVADRFNFFKFIILKFQ
jgi:O-methyltransferase involved in polyketide biosynthesis